MYYSFSRRVVASSLYFSIGMRIVIVFLCCENGAIAMCTMLIKAWNRGQFDYQATISGLIFPQLSTLHPHETNLHRIK